jgi:hypothetical protein
VENQTRPTRSKKETSDPFALRKPRIETPVPSDVVGTLGDEVAAWVEVRLGVELRPWQVHVLRRAYELRADGSLRWPAVLITSPRQCGKSTLTRGALSWRLFQSERFGVERSTILHTSAQRAIAREIWMHAARELEKRDAASIRWANGQEAIEVADGSRWIITAATANAANGLSVDTLFLDEAWDISEAVWESAAPTMLERPNSQVWLVSTAGESSSRLLREQRETAIAQLANPDDADTLIVEWSADPSADHDDERAWEAASPFWNDRRRDAVRRMFRSMPEQQFRTQLLNQFVTNVSGWVSDSAWNACAAPDVEPVPSKSNPGIVAIETAKDGTGVGAVLAVRDPDSDMIVVRARVFERHPELWAWLDEVASERRGIVIAKHTSVRLPDVRGGEMLNVSAGEQVAGFGVTRQAILSQMIAHDGGGALAEHVLIANTSRGRDGHLTISGRNSEGEVFLARALVWAVGHQLRPDTRRRPLVAVSA